MDIIKNQRLEKKGHGLYGRLFPLIALFLVINSIPRSLLAQHPDGYSVAPLELELDHGNSDKQLLPGPSGNTETLQPAKTETKNSNLEVDHVVVFDEVPGLPGVIKIQNKDNHYKEGFLWSTINGKLLVLRLEPVTKDNLLVVKFPTALEKMNYRFQLKDRFSKVWLSREYQVQKCCRCERYKQLLSALPAGVGQRKSVLLEAISLDDDNRRLEYLLEVINKFGGNIERD